MLDFLRISLNAALKNVTFRRSKNGDGEAVADNEESDGDGDGDAVGDGDGDGEGDGEVETLLDVFRFPSSCTCYRRSRVGRRFLLF